MEINKQQYRDANKFWTDYSSSLMLENRFNVDSSLLNIFDQILNEEDAYNFIESGTELFRARIHNGDKRTKKEPYLIKEMGTPISPRPGRLNPEGIKYLYLAREERTCLYEVKPYRNDFITIGRFEIQKEKLKILDLSKDLAISNFEIGADLRIILNLQFSKPIPPMYENEYIPIEFFSEYVKNKKFDGIEYSSSLHSGGKNIALFNEENAKCMDTYTVQIEQMRVLYN